MGENRHFLALVYYYIKTQCYFLSPLAKNVTGCVLVGIVYESSFLTLLALGLELCIIPFESIVLPFSYLCIFLSY